MGDALVRRHCVRIGVLVVALIWVGGGGSASVRQSGLPPGFADRLVARFLAPTAMAFTPDQRVLVTTQLGVVRVIDRDRHLLRKPALDYRSRVCTERERGMTGIAVDPRFSRNHYVYVYYTFKKFGTCPIQSPKAPVNRLSRFVLRGNTIDPATEKPLIDNVPSWGATHNAGDVQFGKDGYIYLGIGDGGRDYAERTFSSEENAAARDLNVLVGKIVRVTSSGRIPPGNPFRGRATVACARSGVAPPGIRCREIFALGLRNPWRLSLDPNAPDTRFLINDVGESLWEEVDWLHRGADYGWNLREGFCPRDLYTRCSPAPSGMTDPIYAYAHRNNCGAITGGAFVPAGAWPSQFEHAYLFGDFNCGRIFLLRDVQHRPRSSVFDSRYNPGLVSMTFGPESALFYTTYASGGEVRRITYEPNRGR